MFPQAAVYETVEELLAARAADAVIVAVPHPMHSEIAMAVLRAGCHVLVEKPVDVAVSRAEQLCAVARESGRVFAVMLNQRNNPLFRRAREIVHGGQLGQLTRTVWIITNWYRTQHYYDSGSWRATWAGEGGGVLLNQAPHNLDLWQWICGMPQSVTAYCDVARYHRIEVEDDATIMTRYANGATGLFITSTGAAPGTNRLEIAGDLPGGAGHGPRGHPAELGRCNPAWRGADFPGRGRAEGADDLQRGLPVPVAGSCGDTAADGHGGL